jgi:hypothetical protein
VPSAPRGREVIKKKLPNLARKAQNDPRKSKREKKISRRKNEIEMIVEIAIRKVVEEIDPFKARPSTD